MYTRVRYSPVAMFLWTRWELLAFFFIAAPVAALYDLAGLEFLHVPWAPIAVIGTAVAFLYGRASATSCIPILLAVVDRQCGHC